MTWTPPSDLTDTCVVLTGATGGLGFHVARSLASRGAEVFMTVRDLRRGAGLVERLTEEAPQARLQLLEADLADLGSLERAARELRERTPSVDVLVNNAGIMLAPDVRTVDGLVDSYGRAMADHHGRHQRHLPRSGRRFSLRRGVQA